MTGPTAAPNTTARLRVTRVECDTCHHIQDFTHPIGPDAHLALNAVLGGQGWKKDGPVHTCRDCQRALDTTEPTTEECPSMTTSDPVDPIPVDPIPADYAPHAYVALWRLNSPHADRPEWDERNVVVIPEWDHERLERLRAAGAALLPIGPDGDTGTRAVVQEVETLRAEVADFQAACKSACEQRDAALEQLAAVRRQAEAWAEQASDYDDDTEQQICDGRMLLSILASRKTEEARDGQ